MPSSQDRWFLRARGYFANRIRGNRNMAQRTDRIREMLSCTYIAHLDAVALQRPPGKIKKRA